MGELMSHNAGFPRSPQNGYEKKLNTEGTERPFDTVREADMGSGDGYITIRHPDTSPVKNALEFISETVKITYSDTETSLQWKDRFQNYEKLNRPAWEVGGSQ